VYCLLTVKKKSVRFIRYRAMSITVAVGTTITDRPRTDPYERVYAAIAIQFDWYDRVQSERQFR